MKITAKEIKAKRVEHGIPGLLLSAKARIARSRLSDIERGYAQPTPEESERLSRALDDLIAARKKVAKFAEECGWPVAAL